MASQAGLDISELGRVAQPAEHQPSSPPPLDDLTPFTRPATREPSLPPQPAVSWDAQTQSFAKRKRSTASQVLSDSSDPAIFSSDDDPALDNYVQGRHKKKRYVGSWFQQRPASSDSGLSVGPGPTQRHGSRSKRPFVPVDSGVFMGSDSSMDDILDNLPPARPNNVVFPPATTTKRPPASQLTQVPRLSQKGRLSEAEAKAQEIIRQCIDRGIEAVDLSAQGLRHVSNPTISLISQIARIPTVERGVPFEHLDPELHLFLWGNQLTRVPGAVFDLEHLTTLSLRGNSLTELPPAIFKLKKLQTLNVSLNSLRFLPVELLELIYDPESSLETLMLHPNPWYQPEGGQELGAPWSSENADRTSPGPGPKGRGCRWLSREPHASSNLDAKLWARSPVEFKDTRGSAYSAFRVRSGDKMLATEDLSTEPSLPAQNTAQQRILLSTEVKTTKVPTLMELALQASARSPYLSELPKMLAETTQNTRMCDLLADTQVYSYTGGLGCTVCKRPVIRPTAQWFEWWEIFVNRLVPGESASSEPRATVQYLTQSPEERLVPFVRRVCSWNCVRDPVRGLGRPSQDEKPDANGGEGMVQE
ncbi:hypothetical protein DHEL01_v204870 [Diaporthe helianthi]|uniref:Leucine Rich Repeat family protein n=1 Tax=Diaporthe helianthi TaxID=158607 RepID=A0A2P5I2K5_DIAHE|nr:hypothetical protein DHEL01_v204870 [Diaporthe helianthi]